MNFGDDEEEAELSGRTEGELEVLSDEEDVPGEDDEEGEDVEEATVARAKRIDPDADDITHAIDCTLDYDCSCRDEDDTEEE